MTAIKSKKDFSLFDFCKKKADKVQIYGEETLDEEGHVIPFVDQAALITHYLQLRKTDINMPYEQQAKGILNLWYEFIKGEKQRKPNDFEGVSESPIGYQTYISIIRTMLKTICIRILDLKEQVEHGMGSVNCIVVKMAEST